MKKLVLCILILNGLSTFAQTVDPMSIREGARKFFSTVSTKIELLSVETLNDREKGTVGFLCHYAPSGFLIVAASEQVAPVYAWSDRNNFDLPASAAGELKTTIMQDLSVRVRESWRLSDSEKRNVARQWTAFLDGGSRSPLFEQWPPEGTTSTGGWLETNWTQTFPYNSMCPMDLNAGARSVAGCPATAMAQILNYHREINQTRFSTGDDYYHNYGTGNRYWIDDDYQTRGFPCYDTLNLWLDTLESAYQTGTPLTNNLKAALTFACGVAAQQVYTASVSGTFGLEQAIMAFQRFGFVESRLVYPEDTSLNTLIANNVKASLVVQLGLLVSTGSGGHNVVVDGYNTDEYYHFNFGWGGSANGWYTLPPENIPYNLTIIEGAVLDIRSSLYTNVIDPKNIRSSVSVYPNPCQDKISLRGITEEACLHLFDITGCEVFWTPVQGQAQVVTLPGLAPGCYLYRIMANDHLLSSGKLIRQ
jgi:hypothetical protein